MVKNKRVYIGLVIIVLAMVLLFIGGFDSETMVYNYTVKEVIDQNKDGLTDRGYRVGGRVIPGSVIKNDEQISVVFEIRDIQVQGYILKVTYEGILPDTFKEDQDVLIEGKYVGDKTMHATKIMTKCASKYEAEY
ncbi:MAG: cytochrome c maturation protein CcmE [Calditrichaeota bacterium]|nr:MAG: cytochrome c maturation protein CcmE [Calditrichota bacterium]